MKYLIFCILFSATSQLGYCQNSEGIRFTDSSWEQLLTLARQQHKLIFMDAHTTWCGPCKWMDKNVFPDPAVSALYNRNFINAYTDMEKGEGTDLRRKYQVRAYPTYLFINGDGGVVHRTVGQATISQFIQYGLDALSPSRNLRYLQSNYAANSSNVDFVSDYLAALQAAYEIDSANAIALQFLQKQRPATLQSHENWTLLQNYVTDASSTVFQYLVDHQQQFERLYGKEEVSGSIYHTYLEWPIHYLRYQANEKVVFDKDSFDRFIARLAASRYEKKNEIIAKSKLTVFSGLKDYTSYTAVVSRMLKDRLIPMNAAGAEQLYFYANMVYRFGRENSTAVSEAAGFAKMITEKIHGISDQNKASYQELYADLLEAEGRRDEAAVVRKSIDHKKLTQAQQSNPFQQLIPKAN